jgi:hypothetical protein
MQVRWLIVLVAVAACSGQTGESRPAQPARSTQPVQRESAGPLVATDTETARALGDFTGVAAFDRSSRLLAAAAARRVGIFDARDAALVGTLATEGEVVELAWSDDGARVHAVSTVGFHTFSREGKLLAEVKTAEWTAASLRNLGTTKPGSRRLTSARAGLTPDRRTFVVVEDTKAPILRSFDAISGAERAKVALRGDSPQIVAWSANPSLVTVAFDGAPAMVVDVTTGKAIQCAICVTEFGRILANGRAALIERGREGRLGVDLVRFHDGRVEARMTGRYRDSLFFTVVPRPDDTRAVALERVRVVNTVAMQDEVVTLLELPSGKRVADLPPLNPDGSEVAWSPNGAWLFECTGHKLNRFDGTTGAARGSIELDDNAFSLVFNHDASLGAIARKRALVIYDLSNGHAVGRFHEAS